MEKCTAFCETLAMANKKFTFSLTMGKATFNFSTFDQRREVPARQCGDLKKAASGQLNRRQKRAFDPAVKQKAAAHAAKAADEKAAAEKAAAEKVAAEKAAAEKAATEKTAEEVNDAAEEAAAAAAGAGPAGEAAQPGPKCSKCHQPTKGHNTSRAGKGCTALPSPEMMRGSTHTAKDPSLEISPVKVDGRQESNSDMASEKEEICPGGFTFPEESMFCRNYSCAVHFEQP